MREHGVAGLSLSEVARAVGMKPPSLYSYFDSKHALYDALFAQGYQQFIESGAGVPPADLPLPDALCIGYRNFVEFARADPARHQLLFQRTIPGFEPSAPSMALAVEAYDLMRAALAAYDVTDQADLDLVTAVGTGLANQQLSNDPSGDRWLRLVDAASDMVAAALRPPRRTR
ncbi:MAG: TetR/AcrR family transcriptional regulator [Actinomycetota bacterium]|nr:TetR/AcrR family transcriptional regulator [Actinomycetota bacterium]